MANSTAKVSNHRLRHLPCMRPIVSDRRGRGVDPQGRQQISPIARSYLVPRLDRALRLVQRGPCRFDVHEVCQLHEQSEVLYRYQGRHRLFGAGYDEPFSSDSHSVQDLGELCPHLRGSDVSKLPLWHLHTGVRLRAPAGLVGGTRRGCTGCTRQGSPIVLIVQAQTHGLCDWYNTAAPPPPAPCARRAAPQIARCRQTYASWHFI